MTTLKRYNGSSWETVGLPMDVGMSPQTLAYAPITSNITGVHLAAMPGLSATVTVPAGRRIRVSAHLSAVDYTDATTGYQFLLTQNGTQVGRLSMTPRLDVNDFINASGSVVLSPAAGTHTYTIQPFRYVGAGNWTVTAGADNPSYLLVEDITGSTLPYQPASVPVGVLAQATRTTDISSATSVLANIPDMVLNVTVPAGRLLKLNYVTFAWSTVTDDAVYIRFLDNGTKLRDVIRPRLETTQGSQVHGEHILSPTAGAHTFQVQFGRAAGSGTVNLGGRPDVPMLFWVEDITATPAPASTAPSSTLAYAETTASQTGITTETALTGLSATVTVPAGRRIRITAHTLVVSSVTTDKIGLRIKEGATTLQFGQRDPSGPTSNTLIAEAIVSPSAGTHTYNVTLARDVGTGTITNNADPTFPSYIIVEDITGSGISGHTHTQHDDTGWIALNTLGYTNGWVDYDAVNYKPHYRKIGNEVMFRGLIKSGTLNAIAFTMPVGFRPIYFEQILPAAADAALGIVAVRGTTHSTPGGVVPVSGSNVYFSLDSIRYTVD